MVCENVWSIYDEEVLTGRCYYTFVGTAYSLIVFCQKTELILHPSNIT